MTPDVKPGKTGNATEEYWRQVYPDWPWDGQQLPPRTTRSRPTKTQESRTRPLDTIFLECGCRATVLPNKETIPHHIKGCHGHDV